MQLVFVSMVAVLLSLGALAQSVAVSGTWDLEMAWPELTSTGECTFQQDGATLTGSCGGGDSKFPVKGRVEGNRLSWQSDVTQDGTTDRMEFSGELDARGTTIRGSCTIVGANSGTFTMKRRS